MAKNNGSANPSFPPFMDMSKFMPDMNSMKMPGFDMEGMMQAQRRTAEAMTQMGQKALAGMQAVMQRQTEMIRESMEESATLFTQAMTPGSPEEKVARQTEFAKTAFEKAVANGREIADMVAQNNREVTEMMTSRVTECMDQMRTACTRGK